MSQVKLKGIFNDSSAPHGGVLGVQQSIAPPTDDRADRFVTNPLSDSHRSTDIYTLPNTPLALFETFLTLKTGSGCKLRLQTPLHMQPGVARHHRPSGDQKRDSQTNTCFRIHRGCMRPSPSQALPSRPAALNFFACDRPALAWLWKRCGVCDASSHARRLPLPADHELYRPQRQVVLSASLPLFLQFQCL